jgi:FixJ family two-component response regulator
VIEGSLAAVVGGEIAVRKAIRRLVSSAGLESGGIVTKRSLVAIVDDELPVREAIRRLVSSAGLESEGFSSAEEFLQRSSDDIPDCLILDVYLPGMSGLELQRQLATDHDRTPIVFITAHNDPGSRALALQAGAIAFLPKPFKEEALFEAIRSAIEPHSLDYS